MERVKFNNCLNKPIRLWNISIGSIIGGASSVLIILPFKGVLWGFIVGAIGFAIGGWLAYYWFLGIIQRWLYWHLPVSKIFVPEHLPESCVRQLM